MTVSRDANDNLIRIGVTDSSMLVHEFFLFSTVPLKEREKIIQNSPLPKKKKKRKKKKEKKENYKLVSNIIKQQPQDGITGKHGRNPPNLYT